MEKRFSSILLLTGFIAIALIFGLSDIGLAGKDNVLDRKPIGEVGFFEINDLTGPTSDSCVPHHNGIWDVIRDTNKKGGIIYNDPKTSRKERAIIKFEWGDNKAQAGPVPSLYERLSTVKPKPVICYMGSSAASQTVVRWTERDHIVQINGPAGQPNWHPPRWSFVCTPDYPGVAAACADWAMKDWKKRGKTGKPGWAWFTLDIPYGRAPIKPGSEDYIRKLGFKIVGTWTLPFTPVDLSTQIKSMIAVGANYCFGNVVFLQFQKIMKDLTRLGVKDKLQFMAGCNGLAREDMMMKVGGEALEGGVVLHFAALPRDMDKPGVKWGHDLCMEYKRPWSSASLFGVFFGRLMIDAVKRALEMKGFPITGDDVFKIMIGPEGFNTGGLMPKIVFSENERRGVWVVHMRGAKDGKIVRISEPFRIPNIKP